MALSLYTWRECFPTSVKDVKRTDIIEHSIDMEPHGYSVMGALPKYTPQEGPSQGTFVFERDLSAQRSQMLSSLLSHILSRHSISSRP